MSETRKTNRAINQKPKLANFIPQDLAVPIISCFGAGILLYFWFGIDPFICAGISIWMGCGYWLFVGDRPWLHLSRLFMKPPRWITARAKYQNQHGYIKIRERNHEN